jgi:hypothetical protein
MLGTAFGDTGDWELLPEVGAVKFTDGIEVIGNSAVYQAQTAA